MPVSSKYRISLEGMVVYFSKKIVANFKSRDALCN